MKVLIVKEAYNGKEIGEVESIVEDNSDSLDQKNQHRFFKNLLVVDLPEDLIGKPISSVALEPANAFWSKEGEEDISDAPMISEHWIKDGVTVYEAPMTVEKWSKDGEDDVNVEPPLSTEKWSKDGEDDVFEQPVIAEHWDKMDEETVFTDPLDDTWIHVEEGNDISWTHHPAMIDADWIHYPSIVDSSYNYFPAVVDNTWSYSPAIGENEFTVELDVEAYKAERIAKAKTELDTDLYIKMSETYGTKDPVSATSNYLTWLSMKNSPEIFSSANLKARFTIASVVAGDTLNTDEEILEYANALLNASASFAVYREEAIQTFIALKVSIENE